MSVNRRGEAMTARQETRSSRRWIVVAFLVFLLCLILWIAAAFILNVAFAESLPFSLNLRSRLAANYAPDEFVGSLGVFRLSIFDEVLLDQGLSQEEAEEQSEKIKIAMNSPVPTATARDFEGKLPFTATSTEPPTEPPTAAITVSPTETPVPTSTLMMAITATNTPKPATGTPAVPSKTPTSGPSLTPSPTKCLVDPIAQILVPPDGAVYTLADNLPAEAFAYDPDNVDPDTCQPIGVYPSDNGAGIDRVEFEIWWLDGVPDVLVHSQVQLSVKYCGFTGTTSCNTFPVNSSTWPGGAPVSGGWHKLKARARDDGGYWSDWAEVEFYLDIGPTATPTYTPVNTSTYTPTPTHTPTPTPTYTPTYTPTPTNTPTYTTTPTPTNTPTPTTDICSLITITGFGHMSNEVWWNVTNGSSTAITIIGININWPTSNGALNDVSWNGSTIWNAGDSFPPAIINSDWTGANRVIDPSQSSQLRFSFNNAAFSWEYAYDLVVTFDNGCMPSND
jgi:hypothetical protein